MTAFFKSGGTHVASKALQAYKELATRILNQQVVRQLQNYQRHKGISQAFKWFLLSKLNDVKLDRRNPNITYTNKFTGS